MPDRAARRVILKGQAFEGCGVYRKYAGDYVFRKRRLTMKLEGKKVLVFGTGKSGIGAAKLLSDEKAEIILYDGNTNLNPQDIRRKCGGLKLSVILGEIPEEVLHSLELVVMSPGVPTDIPLVLKFQEMGIPVWGEVELAYQCGQGDVLAITGTNGKTTTTALVGEIMRNMKVYL